MEITIKENLLKQQAKDLVFSEGFANDGNLPKIYRSLFPDDPDWESHDYVKVDTSSVLVNTLRNDLSFYVGRKNGPDRIIGLEAQSRWSRKDLKRFGNYQLLCNAKALRALSDFNPIEVENYIFVLCLGDEPLYKAYFTYEDERPCPERFRMIRRLPVTVMSPKNGKIPETEVFKEYLRFCQIYKDVTSKYGRDQKALEILAGRCIEEGIYNELFIDRREEIIGGFMSIFSQIQVIKSKELIIEDQDKTINEQKTMLENKDQKIDEQKTTIEDRDRTIDDLKSTVKDVQTKNNSLNNEVKTQAKTIDEQKTMLRSKDNRINELEEELKKFKGKPDGK